MLLTVQRSRIFAEFSEEEQNYWFSIKEKAVAHHVDSLYYTVSIKGDDVQMSNPVIAEMVSDIGALKEEKQFYLNKSVPFFGLEVSPTGASAIYIYRLQMPELYDIFVAKNIVNNTTPRIQVQIRTQGLITLGLYNAIEESFQKVEEILHGYNLEVDFVQETRIDYAFHTNVVQKLSEYFGTDALNKHLISAFSRYGIEGAVPHRNDEDLDLDYFYLGRRKANFLFFRAYEKTKEVVQMNYKGIFFEKWLDRGLISRYDKYVYEYAYKIASFNTGVLVGKIKWYLEYGKDDSLKLELTDALEKYNVNSSNNRELEKRIKGILPPVTKVYNFEMESKRKFYSFYDKFINSAPVELAEGASPELARLYKLLSLRRFFIDMFFTEYVRFFDNRKNLEPQELDFWRRIRSCRISDIEDENKLEAFREYSRRLDFERQKRKFFGSIANFHIFKRKAVDFESGFGEDICDAISFLNDNDIKREDFSSLTNLEDPYGYREVKKQRWRQLSPVIRKHNVDNYKSRIYLSDIPEDELKREFNNFGSDDVLPPAPPKFEDFGDEWRCAECRKVFTGEKNLTQIWGRTDEPPYMQGLCRGCLKKKRDEKKNNA